MLLTLETDPELPGPGEWKKSLRRLPAEGRDSFTLDATARITRGQNAPDGEHLQAAIVIHCEETDWRYSQLMQPSHTEEYFEWQSILDVHVDDLRGNTTVKTIVGETTESGLIRLVSESKPWTFELDETARHTPRGGFPVSWIDFENASEIPLEFRRGVWFLDLTSEEPRLLLNSNEQYEGLNQVLPHEGEPSDTKLRALHQALVSQIGMSSWQALANAAINAIGQVEDDSGETAPEWPVEKWKAEVAQEIARLLYPGADRNEALSQLSQDHTIGDFQNRLQMVLQVEKIQANTAVRKALRAVQS